MFNVHKLCGRNLANERQLSRLVNALLCLANTPIPNVYFMCNFDRVIGIRLERNGIRMDGYMMMTSLPCNEWNVNA